MPKTPLLPLAFTRSSQATDKAVTILAGDVGGTKTNIALYRVNRDGVVLLREGRYASQEYTSLADIIVQFTGQEWPDRICIAVAGPVNNGNVQLTNLSWQLDSAALSSALKTPVVFINDLEANGYGLAAVQSNELANIHSSNGATGNIAVVAPGTGLGEAGLYFDGRQYRPFATEGGHSDFSPRTEQDIELFRYLQQLYGHVSWERVLSGPGIENIFNFLTTVQRKKIPAWLSEQLQDAADAAPIISNASLHQHEPVAVETMQLFVRYLAMEAASVCLKLKATGGCYLGGGIPPKILPLLQTGEFYRQFLDMGRMKKLLEQVPVYVVLNDKTALLGAAYFGAYNM